MNLLKPLRGIQLLRTLTYTKPPATTREDTVVVHGGAGDIPDNMLERKLLGVQTAAHEAFLILKETGNVLDAVELSIKIMENDEIFNVGFGSYLNAVGEIEMDASIMHGEELSAGTVHTVKNIKHPITLAKLVMLRTKHVSLVGDGAMRFARENGVQVLDKSSLVSEWSKEQWEISKDPTAGDVGCVGAVVMDKNGNLAAGASSGGQNRQLPGHCSDCTCIGIGVYADNSTGAVSCSGHEESISKMCLAFSIANKVATMSSAEAIQTKLKNIESRLKSKAGVITISKLGDIGVGFTTKRMPWAYQRGRIMCYGINANDCRETKI